MTEFFGFAVTIAKLSMPAFRGRIDSNADIHLGIGGSSSPFGRSNQLFAADARATTPTTMRSMLAHKTDRLRPATSTRRLVDTSTIAIVSADRDMMPTIHPTKNAATARWSPADTNTKTTTAIGSETTIKPNAVGRN